MVEPCDTIVLAPGVRHEPGVLVDDVRGAAFPLNASAEYLLERGAAPLGELVDLASRRWGLAPEDARRDVLSFAFELNRLALANVVSGARPWMRALTWLTLAVRGVPTARLPATLVVRAPIDTTRWTGAIAGLVRALAGRLVVVALISVAALWVLAAGGGRALLVSSAVVGLSVAVAVLAHEAGHVVALRRIPAAIVLRRGRVSVLHPPLSESRATIVALAGPSVPVVLGVALAAASVEVGSTLSAVAAGPLVAHALSATVVARDGRTACLCLRAPGASR